MFEIPLRKIDEEKRLVIGQAAAEGLDKSGESMDYATAKAAFQDWSAEFERNTNGLSKGNLRVMHTKEVAGKIVDLTFDDVTKAVNIVAHVVSDNAWNLVKSGCFSGFSIGGGYANRWVDGSGLKKYTPRVSEISLVDNPCIPSARFVELIKADGMIEQIELSELRRAPHSFGVLWSMRPVSFAKAWDARARTFGEMEKAASWSASKHPRDHGKFASAGQSGTEGAPAAVSSRKDPATGYEEGMAGGVGLYVAAQGKTGAAVRAAKYGLGSKGARNETASLIRGHAALRGEIHTSAAKARIGGGQKAALADIKASTAMTLLHRANIRPGAQGSGGIVRAIGRHLINGVPYAVGGAILGQQAAYRLQHEQDELPVTDTHTAGATAGDAIRAMKYAGRGGLAGSAVAGVGTYLAMGGNVHNEIRRIGLKQALQAAMADKVGMAHLSRHVGRGAAIGSVASLALTVPQLVREYRDRHASQSG